MTEFSKDADGLPVGSLTAQQASADAADLRAGIDALAGLVANTLGLSELLAEVSTFAVQSRPKRIPSTLKRTSRSRSFRRRPIPFADHVLSTALR